MKQKRDKAFLVMPRDSTTMQPVCVPVKKHLRPPASSLAPRLKMSDEQKDVDPPPSLPVARDV